MLSTYIQYNKRVLHENVWKPRDYQLPVVAKQQSLTRAVPVSGVHPCHAVCTYQLAQFLHFINSIYTS